MDASPETSGGTPSADQYVERLSPESSQSRSITSRSSRSSSKRSSAGVKAPLAKLRLEQAEERFKRELSKEADLQETKEIEEKFRKEREESRKRRRRQAEELEKHCCLIEKRRSEAKRERELELLRLKHRHEAAKLKRSILDQLSEGTSNVIVNHTFSKHRNPTSSHLALQGSEPRRLKDARVEPTPISNAAVDLPTLVRHLTRPRPQAIFFDGDPVEYWKFVRNSQALVDDKIDDSSAKLSYLLQHCQGKTRRLVERLVLTC